MRNFKTLAMMATAVIAVSACSNGDKDMGYFGSRDDIIVNNSGLSSSSVKAEAKEIATAKIETVKADAAQVAVNSVASVQTTSSASTTRVATVAPAPSVNGGDIPPNARPGECYAKVLIPAVTENRSERVQISEEQKMLVRIIPARYSVETERVQIKEARQYWKQGHGPVSRANQVTGEIMCLVEEPAQYKTIERRVLVEAEKPEYKLVPAQFETISKTEVIQSERWEWRRILCETNMGTQSIVRIQQALKAKGYNVVTDGRLGAQTMSAVNSYQLKNGLASRGITYETLSHLGVSLMGM